MRALSTLAMIAAFVAAPLAAQGRHYAAPGRGYTPRQPVARGRPDARPEWERGRVGGMIPYVRGDHWYGHAAPDDPRFKLARPFEHGRFPLAGPAHLHTVIRTDFDGHRVWLAGGFGFEIAAWDWPLTFPWCWDCPGEFVTYLDPDHAGWYLLYNVRFGEYVHVQYLGM